VKASSTWFNDRMSFQQSSFIRRSVAKRAGLVAAFVLWTSFVPTVSAEQGPLLTAPKRPSVAVDAPAKRLALRLERTPGESRALQTARIALPPNQIWLISTRSATYRPGGDMRLKYWRYHRGRWVVSSRWQFLASNEPQLPTCFFVHGNRVTFRESSTNGWSAYRRMAAQAGPRQRFRFVIWSWPSERIRGPLRDVKAKARVADNHAVYLAWLIDQIEPSTQVSFLGYSYGARVVTGALHTLGGGQINGRRLVYRVHRQRTPMRAVLMAAALDNSWLTPRQRHGMAMSQVERLLVMKNPMDRALRAYHFLYGLLRGPAALGYTGLSGIGHLGPHRNKVTQMNVSNWVGTAHDWTRYMNSPVLVRRMRPFALFEDPAAETSAAR
jgi:hypothetical protein